MEGNTGNNAVGVKLTFDGQMRRFPFAGNSLSSLCEQLVKVLDLEKTAELVIKYLDEEEDLITITSDLELRSAIVPGQLLRLIVSLKGANPVASAPPSHYGGSNANDFRPQVPKGGDFRSMIPHGGPTPPGMMGGGRGGGFDVHAFMSPFMAKMAAAAGSGPHPHPPPGMGLYPSMEGAEHHHGPPPGMGGMSEKWQTCPAKKMKKHHKKHHKMMMEHHGHHHGLHHAEMAHHGHHAAMAHHGHHHPHQHPEKSEKLVARFARDVTIEDGTVIPPNTPFVKTWRLRNEGAPWPAGCGLLFVGKKSDDLGGPALTPIPAIVETNQEIDVSVNLASPDKPGRYTGYWRMSTPDGRKFGQRVWTSIVVPSLSVSSSSSEGEREADKYEALVDVVLRDEAFRALGVKRHWVFRLLQKCDGDVNEVITILTKKLDKKAKKCEKKAAKKAKC